MIRDLKEKYFFFNIYLTNIPNIQLQHFTLRHHHCTDGNTRTGVNHLLRTLTREEMMFALKLRVLRPTSVRILRRNSIALGIVIRVTIKVL